MKNFYLFIRNILPGGQAEKSACMAMALIAVLLLPCPLLAQVPAFSYSSPQLYAVGVPISTLSPSSAGGAVAALGFNTTATPITAAGVGGALSMEMDKSGNIYIGESGGNIMLLPAGSSTATVFATGFGPVYSVALDALNNVYAADNTHVWKIPAGGGTPVSLGSFSSPVGLAFNAAGSLFVACNDGSGIFTINTDGTGQAMYLFALPAPAYLAFDTNGNLLIGDQHIGGLYEEPPGGGSQPIELAVGLGAIVSVKTDLSGKVYISNTSGIYCYSPGSGAVNIASVFSYGLMTDASFNLYYTAGGQLYKISPSGGYFTSPQLPRGLVIDPNTGFISGAPAAPLSSTDYTVTAYNAAGSGTATVNIGTGLLPSFSYTTPAIYTVGTPISPLTPSSSSGVNAWGYSGSTTAIGSGYGIPTDVAADAAGNIYLSDYSNNQVVKLPAGGGAAVVLAAGLSSPFGITIDAAGNLYFADAGNNAVDEIPAGTGTVNTIGSGFNGPTAVAVDATGNVYVADAGNNALKKIPAGNGTPVTIQSGFATLEGVAVDGAGNIYAADAGVGNTGNGAVYKIPAGGGSMVAIGTGFARPSGIAADAAGNLYVTDINKSAITIIQPDGTQFTVGSGLNHPNGVCVDAGGNLYIADSGAGKIKEIKITGGYFLSPFLPTGLTFNNNSGLISGTLTVASDANYTVTAHNSYGATAKTVNIGANTAPAISYATPQTFTAGTAITPLVPANTGGTEYAPAFNNYPTTLSIGITDATCTAMDTHGNLYIGESSGKVSVLAPGNTAATVLGSGFGTGSVSGGIAADTSGNVYLADGTWLWKIPAGGGTPVKIDSHNPRQVAVDADNTIYAGSMVSGIYTIAPDGSNRTVIFSGGAAIMAVDQNGSVFFSSRGIMIGLHEVLPGGGQKTIIAGVGFRAFSTDPSGNVYMINSDLSIDMVPAGSSTESQVEPAISGLTSIMVGADLNLYAVVNGVVMKSNPTGGYFTSAELPNGLTMDPSTGIISGTPAAAAPTTIYTVSAFNPVGSSTAPLRIGVLSHSNIATLSNIALSTGFVKHPTDFVSTTFNYASFVGTAVSTDRVIPTSTDPNATITVNGSTVTSGSASQPISLNFGQNLVTIVVTAQDGVTTQTYTDTLYRALSTNSNLLKLVTSKGLLTPGFSNTTLSYAKAVPYGVSSITFTPTTTDANATVTVNGIPTASGTASVEQPLSVGDNVINIKVTAQDGSTKTFTVTVTRTKSSNDKLYSITSNRGALTRNTQVAAMFTKNVNYPFATINFTVTPVDPDATITVGGSATGSGTPSVDQPLAVGNNIIQIIITAADGETSQTYLVTVTRAPASLNTVYQPVGVTGPEANGLQFSADDIKVHEALSPNGDGMNDFLLIEGIADHPDNKLQIMARNGQLIFEAKNYDNSNKVFDGHSNKNGKMQLSGTYFYSLEYIDNGETRHKTGFIILKY